MYDHCRRVLGHGICAQRNVQAKNITEFWVFPGPRAKIILHWWPHYVMSSDQGYSFDLDDDDSVNSISTTTTGTSTSVSVTKTVQSPSSRCIYLNDQLKRLVYQHVALYGGSGDFSGTCNQNIDVFGLPGKPLRRAAQRYRRELVETAEHNPKKFYELATKLGVDPPVKQPHKQQRDKRTSGSRSSLSSVSKSNLNPSRTVTKQKVIPEITSQKLIPAITPPEIMSRPIATFTLDFLYPENNPNNWISYEVVGVRRNNILMNVIVLQKFIYDQSDITTDGLTVTVQPGGRSVLVEEHGLPSCIVRHHAKTLRWIGRNDLNLGFAEAEHQFQNKLQSVVTEFINDKEREGKKYFLAFPNGIKVKSVSGLAKQEPGVDFIGGKIVVPGEPEKSWPKTIHTVATFVFEKDGESFAVENDAAKQAAVQSMIGAFAALNADDSDDE
jgi:hypothetical protein